MRLSCLDKMLSLRLVLLKELLLSWSSHSHPEFVLLISSVVRNSGIQGVSLITKMWVTSTSTSTQSVNTVMKGLPRASTKLVFSCWGMGTDLGRVFNPHLPARHDGIVFVMESGSLLKVLPKPLMHFLKSIISYYRRIYRHISRLHSSLHSLIEN